SLLGGHDPGDPGHAEHVTLGGALLDDHPQRVRLHPDLAPGDGDAVRLRLVPDVNHARLTALVEVRQLTHRALLRARSPCSTGPRRAVLVKITPSRIKVPPSSR